MKSYHAERFDLIPVPDAGKLKTLFGFTPSETLVALGLCRGESLKRSAHARGRAYETARRQLQGVFQKTDTHHQNELVSLLLRVREAKDEAL